MYQRILNEALLELREEEFPALQVAGTAERKDFVAECVIESDFEVLIPETYVENISERVRLYRELDNISTEEELEKFGRKLQDRFGGIPRQVSGLMEIVRMRRWSMAVGVERLLMKNGKMILYFVSSQTSPFYSSAVFTRLLKFVQLQMLPCRMSEKNDKLSLAFTEINDIEKAARFVKRIWQEVASPENGDAEK